MQQQHEVAFEPVAGEVSIPITEQDRPLRLRRRWFKLRNQATFSTFLPARFPPSQPWTMLTIGVFEGAAEVWLMQNVLTHPDSRLYCIDPWEQTTKLDQAFMHECRQNAEYNLLPWAQRVTLTQGYSQDVMSASIARGNHCGVPIGTFDLVIIDGDHNLEPVYQDAVNALEFVKPNGWLLFDDVRNRIYKPDHVYHGIEKFLGTHRSAVEKVFAHRYMDCYRKR